MLGDAAKEKAKLDQRKAAEKKPSAACKNAYAADAAGLTAFTARAQMLKGPAEQYLTAASTADEKIGAARPQSHLAAEAMRAKMFNAYLSQLKPAFAISMTLTKRSHFSSNFPTWRGSDSRLLFGRSA